MSSTNEKILLKQITDLTRQIEKQKKGYGRSQFQTKKFVKLCSKNPSTVYHNAYANTTQRWHKPVLPNLPVGQPATSIHKRSQPKIPESEPQSCSQRHNFTFDKVVTKPKQVFVNPNFVQGEKGRSVHVNPNFQPQATASHPSGPSKPQTMCVSMSTTGATVSGSASAFGSVTVGPRGSCLGPVTSSPAVAGPIPSIPGGPSGSRLGPTTPTPAAAGPSPSVLGSPSVRPGPAAPAVAGRTRRRSRSSSSVYRLLTARKLVRRLSKEARTPPAPAASRRAATVHTRHKLVRVTGAPAAQPSSRLVSTRHRLIRAAPAARPQQQLVSRTASSSAGGVSSRFKLVRRPTTAAAGGVPALRPALHTQHRTWKRRTSVGTPSSRLTSAGSLRLGSARFVNIGGLLYKSTARKLQRAVAEPPPRSGDTGNVSGRVAGCISVRGARFRVEAGGRSLRRLGRGPPAPPRLDIGGLTFRPAGDGTLTADSRQQASRSLISRAKSRSLAVLRGSLRLSRQPCRFYCRLGRCRRHERGQCPHVHDAALRPICTRQLREGGCQRPGCPYNHQPRPEKVPHCLHFLTAECRRDPCPYLHVNVDADAPLCAKFLAGFCPRGQQCTDKHLYICPEFSDEGKCPRGAACPLAHRARRRRQRPQRPDPAATATRAPPRGGGRYYLGGEGRPAADDVPTGPESDTEEEEEGERERRQRPVMAEMPSFIAVGDSSGDEE